MGVFPGVDYARTAWGRGPGAPPIWGVPFYLCVLFDAELPNLTR